MKLTATVTISIEFDVEEVYLNKTGKTSYQVLDEIIKDRLDPWTHKSLPDGLSLEAELHTEIRQPSGLRTRPGQPTPDYGLAF